MPTYSGVLTRADGGRFKCNGRHTIASTPFPTRGAALDWIDAMLDDRTREFYATTIGTVRVHD